MSHKLEKEILHEGYIIRIYLDDDANNPRDEENLGTMICFHKRHRLGDYKEAKKYSDPTDFFAALSGIDWENDERISNMSNMEQFHELRRIAMEKNVIVPIYMLDHSGISIATTSFNDAWDSGLLGYIYAPLDSQTVKEWSPEWKDMYHEGKTDREIITFILEEEVKEYNAYINGECYMFTITKADGTEEDYSMKAGYIGSDHEESGLMDAARSAIAEKNIPDFWVECDVCKQRLKNWTGSTPCCGSVAWIVEDGKVTDKISLYASLNDEPPKPTII